MKKATDIVLICLFVKLLLAAWVPFFFDESYYWFWSKNLQLSYYDHPPFVSWLFYLGQIFDSFGQASRWPGIFMSQASVYIWLQILKDHLEDKKLSWFALLMSFWPLFGFLSVVITPDIPLVFFWSLSIWSFQSCLKNPSLKNYSLLGLSLGLGGASKYQIALIVPCFLIYLIWQKKWREIRWSYLGAVVFFGLLGCSPVLLWNAQNNWDSILFQIHHGLGSKSWKPVWTLDYLWTQTLILFPPVLYFALKNFRAHAFFHSFAWFPLLFFLFSSTKGRVEANWPLMAYPAVAALAILNSKGNKWLKYSIGIWLCISLLVLSNFVSYWLPVPIEKTKLYETKEFQGMEVIARSYTPLYGSSFQMSSYLSYLSKTSVCKLRDYHRKDFFDYLDCSIPKAKRYYFLVSKSFRKLPDWAKDHKIIQSIALSADYQILEIEQP